jgi:DNA-binding NarL/FixJ family response regulator
MVEAEQGSGTLPRIGLVVTDEVRAAGLCAVLSDGGAVQPVQLSEPGALETAGLQMVVVDAAATDHLLELLASFRRLRPLIRLLVLGGDGDAAFVERAIAAGARGVLSHAATERELLMAIEVVSDGSVWAPRKILSRLLDSATRSPFAPAEVHLTKRELEVLRLLVEGMSNPEIAEALEVEPAAVKAHVGRLMRKAGVTNRTQLGVHALAEKWV